MRQTVCAICHLSLDLQKEIHDLFTVTFGYSLAIGMCVYAYIIYFICNCGEKKQTKKTIK